MPHVQHGPSMYLGSKFLTSHSVESPLHCSCWSKVCILPLTYPIDADKSEFIVEPGIIMLSRCNLSDTVFLIILVGCTLQRILLMTEFHKEVEWKTKLFLAKSRFIGGSWIRWELVWLEVWKVQKEDKDSDILVF